MSERHNQKKIPETNAIFDRIRQARLVAQSDPHTLRISIDLKAKVPIGPFSRRGLTRNPRELKACDHDLHPEDVLVPCGILEVEQNQLTIGFGHQTTTSDMVMDNLELWWQDRREAYPHIRKLLIELDNGQEVNSHRKQFLKRMTEYASMGAQWQRQAGIPKWSLSFRPFTAPT